MPCASQSTSFIPSSAVLDISNRLNVRFVTAPIDRTKIIDLGPGPRLLLSAGISLFAVPGNAGSGRGKQCSLDTAFVFFPSTVVEYQAKRLRNSSARREPLSAAGRFDERTGTSSTQTNWPIIPIRTVQPSSSLSLTPVTPSTIKSLCRPSYSGARGKDAGNSTIPTSLPATRARIIRAPLCVHYRVWM